jgi:ribonuclease HIII
VRQPDWPIIGVDESGKGDFFGPLVIAGALVEEDQLPFLAELGVRDSKTIADGKIITIAGRLRERLPCEVVVIGPEKYNELYSRIRNLNKLLGWGHARVIENLLAKRPANAAISDKFGHDRFIIDNLQKEGKKIELIQMVRGEAHPAVAAASILARAEFLRRMDEMSERFGVEFPRGASSTVDAVGRRLISSKGTDILARVAKLHFKNFNKIVGC